VDFTEGSRPAFDWSVRLARANAAELSLVHVVRRDYSFSRNARECLRDLAELRNIAKTQGVTAVVSVQSGSPGNAIASRAAARQAGLIVIGTKGRTGWDRFRKGSVAERLLRRTSCQTLIVPTNSGPKPAHEAGMHILCAMGLSGAPLHEALRLATTCRGKVSVVHVLNGVESATAERLRWHFAVPEYRRALEREAHLRMEAAIPRELLASLDVQIRVLEGVPHRRILGYASQVNADLIVIGAGARGFRRIFGSTTSRLVRGAAIPVLVLPADAETQEGGLRLPSEVEVAA
jgi:nucleotide-binding universal stress UspA family protein